MAWAGTVTNHGAANKCADAGSISVGTFTPAADSLLVCVVANDAGLGGAGDLSGHDAGTAWAQIGGAISIENREASIFAAHPGGSPSSGSVTLDTGYAWTQLMAVFEITDTYVDGTIAQSFGTVVTDEDNYNVGDQTCVLASFSNSEGLTLAIGLCISAAEASTFEGTYTQAGAAATGCNGLRIQLGYYGGEDNSVVVTGGENWSMYSMAAVEVVGIAAGGGGGGLPVGSLSLLGVGI